MFSDFEHSRFQNGNSNQYSLKTVSCKHWKTVKMEHFSTLSNEADRLLKWRSSSLVSITWGD